MNEAIGTILERLTYKNMVKHSLEGNEAEMIAWRLVYLEVKQSNDSLNGGAGIEVG